MAQSKAARPAMAKYLIPILALAASALADNAAHDAGSYAAPPAYSPPVDNYPPPDAYGPPADTYGAPDPYNAAPTYEDNSYAPQDSYGAVADCRTTGTCGDDLFDLSKISELLPLFLAVFAAIIVAQLFAPLIGMIFGAKVGLATTIFTPFRGILVGLIQALLRPFNLALCDLDAAGMVTGIKVRSFGAKSFANDDMLDAMSTMILNAVSAYDQ